MAIMEILLGYKIFFFSALIFLAVAIGTNKKPFYYVSLGCISVCVVWDLVNIIRGTNYFSVQNQIFYIFTSLVGWGSFILALVLLAKSSTKKDNVGGIINNTNYQPPVQPEKNEYGYNANQQYNNQQYGYNANQQYNNQQYGYNANQQYNNAQYGYNANQQYNNQQYDYNANQQYNNAQYNNAQYNNAQNTYNPVDNNVAQNDVAQNNADNYSIPEDMDSFASEDESRNS